MNVAAELVLVKTDIGKDLLFVRDNKKLIIKSQISYSARNMQNGWQ